ncbi:mind kinetochore complex component [Colletotrichum karsti]|uniref:Mind kinetochore complex component n=1 Tax=Colletotrichum karsti TaxID=1095194 RepID=A0A9P6I5I9_9PEZI|nr:mind kinetochore complex component [Colletotrichum karsti]KAF9877317.1 mind kinetochore complex component [Colletotrichum karsti]
MSTTDPNREQPPQEQAPQQPESQTEEPQNQTTEAQDEPPQQQQQQEQPPASPPLPQKHTAVTPGVRAGYFEKTYNGALQKTLQAVRFENFADCFPTIAANAPNTLRNVQKQMADYLEDRCSKDFQTILAERDVVRKLNEFESLVSDADRRRLESGDDAEEPIPPHLLPPEVVIKAHMAPRLAAQQSHMNARLQNTQASNEVLFASIQAQRAEIAVLIAQLEGHVADVDGANGMLVDVAPELAAEARDAEALMSGM